MVVIVQNTLKNVCTRFTLPMTFYKYYFHPIYYTYE